MSSPPTPAATHSPAMPPASDSLHSDGPDAAAIRGALGRDDAVSVRAFDRVTTAIDASHYVLTPTAVVTPNSLDDVAALFAYATRAGERLTFRSGGTSLSGQASTDGILVDVRRHFRSMWIEEDGNVVRVQPGATVRQVNARLRRHGRKLGPDPASEIACTIGGVVANNSSGMSCGIEKNAYRTLRSAVIVLPSGTIIDTSAHDADERLREAEPHLWNTLRHLRDYVRTEPTLAEEIARQHRIKNTMGYGLNSLLDYSTPAEMLAHLMVGSEGTLGFIAEATFTTVPVKPHTATALLLFETLRDATDALVELVATHPSAIELMDAASLRAARSDPGSREALPAIDIIDHCALLVEYEASTPSELTALSDAAAYILENLPLRVRPRLIDDPRERATLWRIRKGLYATIAEARQPGTTALLEDIAVPVAQLTETCAGLHHLFEAHGYGEAVIFGHAKDGNIHFLLAEDFGTEAGIARYRAFTEDLVDLVLDAGGTLKAEHGTGRIMAPFVERQYGPSLYSVMLAIKDGVDPSRILSPDIVLTHDPELHLRHLKTTPVVDDQIDRCVDCGYCEPVCPSKDLTTTPRQRIAVQRALTAAENSGNAALARELRAASEYEVIDTCAVDGMCQTVCPVRINTGDLVRRLRSENVSRIERGAWNLAGTSWGTSTRVASAALTIAAAVPSAAITGPNRAARKIVGADALPLWSRDLPAGGRPRTGGGPTGAHAVYFPSCVGAMFGPSHDSEGVTSAFESLAEKATIGLVRPAKIASLCCGTPWKSKGIRDGYERMASRTAEALWSASHEGALPIVCDNSSCTEGLMMAVRELRPSLQVVDVVDFTVEHIMPRLRVAKIMESVAVHPTCSSTRAGSNENLLILASALANSVTVPDDWSCCAFAGDRGMLHPELTASATAREAEEIGSKSFDAYVSCNRTCEIGMSRATGQSYTHVLEQLNRAAAARV